MWYLVDGNWDTDGLGRLLHLDSDLDCLAPEPRLLTNTVVVSPGQDNFKGQKGIKEEGLSLIQEKTSGTLGKSHSMVNHL